jgi:hypothetical protein
MFMRNRSTTNVYHSFAALLALLLLLSTIMAVLHHHENTADDHDCPICIASNHQSAAGPSTIAFDGIPCLTETTFVASAQALIENLFSPSRNTRGPPA